MKKKSLILIVMLCLVFVPPALAIDVTKENQENLPFQSDFQAINKAAQSVFLLEVYNENDQLIATGSGFVAFNNNTLITNEHVIEDAAYIIAYSDQYKASYKLTTLKAVDENRDIAILKIDNNAEIEPLTYDISTQLFRGQPVVAIGSPQGIINTVSSGNISNIVLYSSEIPDCIQFTAPISSGSSGGALFNEHGAVIGLCVSALKTGEAMYYAIPMKYVKELFDNALENNKVSLEQYNNISSVVLEQPTILSYSNFRFVRATNHVQLRWDSLKKAKMYKIFRKDSYSDEFTFVQQVKTHEFVDYLEIRKGQTFEYYVVAIYDDHTSGQSNVVSITAK